MNRDRLAALALIIADQVQAIEQLRQLVGERDAEIARLKSTSQTDLMDLKEEET